MSCTSRGALAVATAAAIVSLFTVASTCSAQLGLPTATPQPYHAPALILAQPSDGGALPADKPVVVFRFAQGETTDPVDALSFVVSVDGVDFTKQFQLENGEAWGMIDTPSGLSASSHDVRARICSGRGSCSTVHATVSTTAVDQVVAARAALPTGSKNSPVQKARSALGTVDRVLQAARILAH